MAGICKNSALLIIINHKITCGYIGTQRNKFITRNSNLKLDKFDFTITYKKVGKMSILINYRFLKYIPMKLRNYRNLTRKEIKD